MLQRLFRSVWIALEQAFYQSFFRHVVGMCNGWHDGADENQLSLIFLVFFRIVHTVFIVNVHLQLFFVAVAPIVMSLSIWELLSMEIYIFNPSVCTERKSSLSLTNCTASPITS